MRGGMVGEPSVRLAFGQHHDMMLWSNPSYFEGGGFARENIQNMCFFPTVV